jgi:hypothetical protein
LPSLLWESAAYITLSGLWNAKDCRAYLSP